MTEAGVATCTQTTAQLSENVERQRHEGPHVRRECHEMDHP